MATRQQHHDLPPDRPVLNRRQFTQAFGAAVLAAGALPAGEVNARLAAAPRPVAAPAQAQPSGDIAMLVYPKLTALDLVGPQLIFAGLRGPAIHLVWKDTNVVVSDSGIPLQPTTTFSDCPDELELLFVPGSFAGLVAMMDDLEVLDFLQRKAATAKLVTSVCTGSLILGAAGLLRGYQATSHWAVRDLLPLLGAELVTARYVEDRNRITGAGVTAGLDFGLRIAARLRGDEYAQTLQLNAEYDPQPPFQAGAPETAPAAVLDALRARYGAFLPSAREAAERARRRLG